MITTLSSRRATMLWALMLALTSWPSIALDVDLHFWPTTVELVNAEDRGALYALPEFKIIVQKKDGSNFKPASLAPELKSHLEMMFATLPGSAVKITVNDVHSYFGFTVPGGIGRNRNNEALVQPMSEKFIACLRTLPEDEMRIMKAILYAPTASLNDDGSVDFTTTERAIVATMVSNFQNNRCANGTTEIPELVHKQSEHYLSLLLTGQGLGGESTVGSQLVLIKIFGSLWFSVKGLWVRTCVDAIKNHINKSMDKNPLVLDASFLKKDYVNFIDFVLSTKTILSKDQYVQIASATKVFTVFDAFKPFPLKQLIDKQQLRTIDLQNGTKQSTFFYKGATQ